MKCGFSQCDSSQDTFTLTGAGQKQTFCCQAHILLWLIESLGSQAKATFAEAVNFMAIPEARKALAKALIDKVL